MITEFQLADTYEPLDLLRLSKDAFYEVIEQGMSEVNGGKNIEVRDAKLEFVVDTVDYVDYVYIKVTVTDYSIEE